MICTSAILPLDSVVCFTWSCTHSIPWLAGRESSPLSDTDRHGEGSMGTSALTPHLIVIWRASLYLSAMLSLYWLVWRCCHHPSSTSTSGGTSQIEAAVWGWGSILQKCNVIKPTVTQWQKIKRRIYHWYDWIYHDELNPINADILSLC